MSPDALYKPTDTINSKTFGLGYLCNVYVLYFKDSSSSREIKNPTIIFQILNGVEANGRKANVHLERVITRVRIQRHAGDHSVK